MGLAVFAIVAGLEIALTVWTCAKEYEGSERQKARLIVRFVQLAVVIVAMLLPAGQNWRFIPVLCLLAVLLVFAIVFALVRRSREDEPRKPARAIVACVASVLLMGILSIPAFVFTGYDGLPTTGEYQVVQASAILVDESRTDPFEEDGSAREVPVHFYEDGEGVITATATPEGGRALRATGRICAEAKYVGLGFTPWDGIAGATHRQYLTHATFAAEMARYSYLNFQYLFYSCTNLAGISGLGNLSGVRSMRFMFASTAAEVLDFRGFDSSALTDLYYAFSSCSKLTTIYADASWALPTSGISGSQCFYSCSDKLVGGNGTVWASSKTAYTYFRIDTATTPGYITTA